MGMQGRGGGGYANQGYGGGAYAAPMMGYGGYPAPDQYAPPANTYPTGGYAAYGGQGLVASPYGAPRLPGEQEPAQTIGTPATVLPTYGAPAATTYGVRPLLLSI